MIFHRSEIRVQAEATLEGICSLCSVQNQPSSLLHTWLILLKAKYEGKSTKALYWRGYYREGHFIESMKCDLEKNANTSYIRL